MSRLKKLSLVTAKVETTYNTDAVPTAALNAFLVQSLDHNFTGQKMFEQGGPRSTFGKGKSLYGGALRTVSFEILMAGTSAAGTAPRYGAVLRACGLDEAIVAVTSVTYAPITPTPAVPNDSATLYIYDDGKLYKLTGCRGTASLNLSAGEAGKISVTMTGHLASVTDVALPSPTLDGVEAPTIKGASFTVDSYAAVIGALTLDLNNTVATPPSVNGLDGYGEITITDNDITGTIDPEDPLLATKDFINDWQTGKEMALSTGVIGSVAGNRHQISMSKIAYRDVAEGDRDGIATKALTYAALQTTGDDQFAWTIT